MKERRKRCWSMYITFSASTDGNVVYLDKSTQNMHELDNRVRLINVTEYPIQNTDQFIGFVCGICSQDYDLQEIYLDGFLKIAKLEGQDISSTLSQLNQISEQFHVKHGAQRVYG